MALTEVDAARLNDNVFNAVGPFTNRIINGDMRIDARNAGASVTPTNAQYLTDRWKVGATQSSKFTAQQSTTAPAGFKNSLLLTSSSAYTPTSSDEFEIIQFIEGNNVADLGFGTSDAQALTLSFYVRSSLTGAFGGCIYNGAATRSYPFAYSISAANTWERKTITFAGDATGTWATDNTAGINVLFSLGAGSNNLGTAGAWTGSFKPGATGQTNLVATNGATFYITGVQLEAGTVATPFERRSYGQELSLCQRYYRQNAEVIGTWISSNQMRFNEPFVIPMRVSPDLNVITTTAYHEYWSQVGYGTINSPVTVARIGTTFVDFVVVSAVATGRAMNQFAMMQDNVIGYTAEL